MRRRKLIAAAFGDSAAATPADFMETGAVTRDVERLLGCDNGEARRIARESVVRLSALGQLSAGAPLPAAPLSPPDRAGILALPFTTDAVLLLHSIERPMLIEKTPLTRSIEPLFGKRAELVTSDMLLRRNREAGARPLFVTFPEHHLTSDGTTRTVRFLGGEHHFSLLEVLLLVRGAAPLVTLRAAAGGLELVTFDAPIDAAAVREADALAVVAWLAENIESVIRFAPERVLSWRGMAPRTAAAMRLRRAMDARLLQALVRAGGALPEEVRTRYVARLRSIEELQREGDAA